MTLDSLCERTADELLRTPNFSRKVLKELRELLAFYGKAFAGEVLPPNPIPAVAAASGIPEEQLTRFRKQYEKSRSLERRLAVLKAETAERLMRAEKRLQNADRAGSTLLAEIYGGDATDWKRRIEALGLAETNASLSG